MTTVWFTADTHFGHKNIPLFARRRFCLDEEEAAKADELWKNVNSHFNWSPSWASVSRMDDHLIRMINDRVAADDILWHLGDFCFGRKRERLEATRRYLERINCRNVFLIRGNHDSHEITPLFKSSYETHEIKVQSKLIVMSHYASCFWNKSHYGSWNLYGHAHGTAELWLDKNMPGRLSMDVGVDNIFRIKGEYRPISFQELEEFFSGRKGCQIDGHIARQKVALQISDSVYTSP